MSGSTVVVVAAVVVVASVSGLIAGWIDRPTWFTGSVAAWLFIVSVAALAILTLDQVGAFRRSAPQPAAAASYSPSVISSPQQPTQRSDPPKSRPVSSPDVPTAQSKRASQPSLTPSPLSTNIPLLKPTNDPGFTSIWHGTLMVNDTGVRITDSGVYLASVQDWDLAYQSSTSYNGWIVNNQTSEDPAIFTYTGPGTPGPEWCRRAFEGDNGLTGGGAAEPGEKYCYIDLGGMVGYLQVNNVGSNGPTVTAWFWKGPPP